VQPALRTDCWICPAVNLQRSRNGRRLPGAPSEAREARRCAVVVGKKPDTSSNRRAIERVDETIAELKSSVRRMARLGHGHLSSAAALSRTYRAERQIAVLREQRSALVAGDIRRAAELSREFMALRSVGPAHRLATRAPAAVGRPS
jgi:hypothetical protein